MAVRFSGHETSNETIGSQYHNGQYILPEKNKKKWKLKQ